MTVYDEENEENLSNQNVFSSSAIEINIEDNKAEQPAVHDSVSTAQQNGLNNRPKERPRSMPPEPSDPEANQPRPVPRIMSSHAANSNRSKDNGQEERRPVPRPRPRTMIIRAESADNLLRSKTMSAENLLRSIPAIDRVTRTESEVGPPPVPLKRAQMYRSQEWAGNNGFSTDKSKESKF